MLTEEMMQELAVFRYGVIAPVVTNTDPTLSKEAMYRELAKRTYTMPDGKTATFAPGTIKKWFLKYSEGGLHSLWPKHRMDLGTSRALTDEQIQRIDEMKQALPDISGQKIWEKMIEKGYMKPMDASVDTIQRYLRNSGQTRDVPTEEHLAFEFEHANDLWQADTVEVDMLHVKGISSKVYLITWIDDYSRMVVGSRIFFEDNAVNAQAVLKEAIKKNGVPNKALLDNGSPYKTRQFTEICAELGTVEIHCRPYHPEGKGKVERNHRTHFQRFFDCNTFEDVNGLEKLNLKFSDYLRTDYQHHIVRTTGASPRDRFMRDYEHLRFLDANKVDFIFLHRAKPVLNKDSTIQFQTKRYEVPAEYISTLTARKPKVPIRFDPLCTDEVYIVDEANYQILYTLKPVDLVANSKRKRKSRVDYGVLD